MKDSKPNANEAPLVLITDASSGIGAGVAKLFSQTGYSIGLLARNIKAMQDLKLPNAICIRDLVIAPTYYEA